MIKQIKKYYNSTKFNFDKQALDANFIQPITWTKIFYKTYPRFPSRKLELNKKQTSENFENLLLKRKTCRELSGQVDYETLSYLLFYSVGIKPPENQDPDSARRMYPSAGARYPLETYVISNNITDLERGIHHFNVKENTLERLLAQDVSEEMINILNSEMGKAPLLFALTGVLSRTEVKYRTNAYRFSLIESGHVGQNIYLLSQKLSLGCCAIAGFNNDRFSKLLDLTEDEVPLYIFAIGKKPNISQEKSKTSS